ncbi:MAG: hypothetical protein H0W15_10215 [Gemmatimonadales bacterium]|nr:hypothetical protein [Gemmatimonadales bacterium]
MIRLSVLGTVDLRDANEAELRQVVMQPKRLALLAYMAASASDIHRRDTLVGLFWPELDSERARAALSKALHHLRASLGPDVLVTRGDEEVLVERNHLWCDAAAFEQALDQGRAEAALGLYGGDLLKGFFLSDAPEFEHWVEGERERLRRRAAAAAWALAENDERAANLAGAANWARRAQLLSPDDEAGLRRLLAVLERAGDRAGAVRVYEDFASHLAREYELTPSQETQALVARMKAEPPVHAVGPQLTPPPVTPAPATTPPLTPAPTTAAPLDGASVPLPAGAKRRTGWLVAAGAALVIGTGSIVYFQTPGEGPMLDPQRVVVAPFENRTGERVLDPVGSMATDWIIQGLSHTGLVEVVPFTATLGSARLGPSFLDPGDTAERVAALARETGAGLVVAGSYYLEGDSLVVQARITDAIAGKVLLALDPIRADRNHPLTAVEALRQRVMASLAPYVDARMSDYARIISRTPSYEAYREYAEGMDLFIATNWQGAIERFTRAVEYDTAYTSPLVLTAIAYANLGDYGAVDSVARLVEPYRHRLAEYDRLAITAATAWARGDYATSYDAARRVAQLAPNTIAHGQLAREGLILNRPREALRVLSDLDPSRGELRGWFPYWNNLTTARHLLGDHRREAQDARNARALFPDTPEPLRFELRALAAEGRAGEVAQELDAQGATPGAAQQRTGQFMREAAVELRAHGKEAEADTLFARSLRWYLERPADVQREPAFRRALGEAYYMAGKWDDASRILRELAVERPDDISVRGRLGTLAARRGDRVQAERIFAELAAEKRPYLLGQHTYWCARIAALLGDRARAVSSLREAFAQGRTEWIELHRDRDLEMLRDYRPFRQLLRPKG